MRPIPPGYLSARGAEIIGCRAAHDDRGSWSVGQRGGGTITAGEPGWCRVLGSRSAFPGREFQSHLTVPLRRLYEVYFPLTGQLKCPNKATFDEDVFPYQNKDMIRGGHLADYCNVEIYLRCQCQVSKMITSTCMILRKFM